VTSVAEAIARGRETLLRGGIPKAEVPGDAEVLARHVLGWDLAQLLSSRNEPPPPAFERQYAALIDRRLAREPVSQIVGHREFWGLDFEVTRDVLTPRPETEALVAAALDVARRDPPSVIVDAGTGSGCIAIALATELPDARLVASDISPRALAVARRNAVRHGVDSRIAFVQSELLVPEMDVELIVSNPPYIPLRDAGTLAPEVREHEPHVALFGGEDGLDAYRKLLGERVSIGSRGGRLIVEVGYDQARAVAALADPTDWSLERIDRDLQGVERVLTFRATSRTW
jgi:release factor glutamine methyltransferase